MARTRKIWQEKLNVKYPGAVEAQATHLTEEGHTIEPGKGKKPPKVKDFESALDKCSEEDIV